MLDNAKYTILVVDDEEILRNFVRLVLKEAGYRVLAACSGKEALLISEEDHLGKIDLVVTDINMPDMDGIELVRCLRKNRPEIKKLAISGLPANAARTDREGIPLLPKPFNKTQLLEAVANAIGK